MLAAIMTPAARRHAARMARTIAPFAARLDRDFRSSLKKRSYDAAQIRAFVAITPSARSQLRSLDQFLEQVDYNGRRLAKMNVPPSELNEVLRDFSAILDPVLGEQFQPAREQLHLATIRTLENAYYRVREAETQAFFGFCQAEIECRDIDGLLRKFVGILTQTFRARAGRLFLLPTCSGKLGKPFYVEHGSPDERLIVDGEMRGKFRSYWSFPLSDGALVQLGFPTRYPWMPRELALLEAAGERCRAAMERARLEAEVRRLEADARRAEEMERRRIGRELHDEAGQCLLLLRLQLEMIERDAPEPLRPRLRESREVAERTVSELRRIVAALSPAVLERLGLPSALRHLVARFRETHRVRFQISVGSKPFPMQMQEVIYRVAQESLQNILKHSGASRVNLLLQESDKKIRLSVSDNGAGFDAEKAAGKPMSFGLAGMRERVALLGGTLTIRSRPQKGTTVAVELPHEPAMVASDE